MWLEIAQSHNLLLQQRFAFYVGWCYMIPTYYGYFFASFTYQICQRSQSTNVRIHGSAEFVEKCFASVSGGCCGGGCRYCPLIISYIQLCHLPNCTPSASLSLSLFLSVCLPPSIFTHCNRDWYFSRIFDTGICILTQTQLRKGLLFVVGHFTEAISVAVFAIKYR